MKKIEEIKVRVVEVGRLTSEARTTLDGDEEEVRLHFTVSRQQKELWRKIMDSLSTGKGFVIPIEVE